MKELSIINTGYVGCFLQDHPSYEWQIEKSTPLKSAKISIIPHYFWGDIVFNFNVNNHLFCVDATLDADMTDDIIYWLENICQGYETSFLLFDAEGTDHFLRFYSKYGSSPEGRFTLLSTDEYYYDEKIGKFKNDLKVYKRYRKTKEIQMICDLLISKKEFVEKFYKAILQGIKNIPKDHEFDDGKRPIKKSKIIEKFLQQ